MSWYSSNVTGLGSSFRELDSDIELADWQITKMMSNRPSPSRRSDRMPNALWSDSTILHPEIRKTALPTYFSHGEKTPIQPIVGDRHSQSDDISLLHSGADPDLSDSDGYTALHIAAENGHADIVSSLIGANCDLDVLTLSGRTALHLAAENNHFEVVERLLRAGCDPNIPRLDQ